MGRRAPAPPRDEGPCRWARHHRPVVDERSDLTSSTTPSTVRGGTGKCYVASLHPNVTKPMKLELPKGTDEQMAAATLQALAACADDGRIPGYPYPLLDAHRAVLIDEALVTRVQQDIKAGLVKQGIRNRLFEDLFGDLHDDFERY